MKMIFFRNVKNRYSQSRKECSFFKRTKGKIIKIKITSQRFSEKVLHTVVGFFTTILVGFFFFFLVGQEKKGENLEKKRGKTI